MFVLNVGTIRTDHEHFDRVFQPQAFESGEDGFRVAAPIELSFDVRKDDDRFQLTGRVATTLELMCSRCLEPFEWAVDQPFDLRYLPDVGRQGSDDLEIQEDDFSTALYENEEIDLGQLIRERLYLSLPMKPLCRESCSGLCPQCGANLNRSTCECRREWADPRFAALRALKKES